mmetsp:Transcript_76911/g.133081  ORF Transcript_76911/g.133081 Transcript_76911/m.133081 type:complete len:114 (+) Transcript_76911:776-1117(+)
MVAQLFGQLVMQSNPSIQFVHEYSPSLYVFNGQMHLDCVISAWFGVVSAPLQRIHAVAAGVSDHEPFAQSSHADWPSVATNDPGLHVMHVSEPDSRANLPAAHNVQNGDRAFE